ncbi:hypothetical protein [Peptostreptococcus faecalis]|uniref:hypothetical protein n=1 Tax=Peptostreptococcus faecalis TaxID=2045015 RepID=UPI000C79AE4D|nr:hypothetical protein [Peptostreptococcus faecalis]
MELNKRIKFTLEVKNPEVIIDIIRKEFGLNPRPMYKIGDKIVEGKFIYEIEDIQFLDYYDDEITIVYHTVDRVYNQYEQCIDEDDVDHVATKTVQKCSDEELKAMKYIDEECNWISKDENGRVYGEKEVPIKLKEWGYWKSIDAKKLEGLKCKFPSIKWEDEEPTKIVRLENI